MKELNATVQACCSRGWMARKLSVGQRRVSMARKLGLWTGLRAAAKKE
jgi:hypothetical protein